MTLWFSDLGVTDPVKSGRAFAYIVRLLEQKDLPYMISGGLAARCYGAKRPLADIDIGIDFAHDKAAGFFGEIKNLSRGYIKYKDAEWDVPIHMFEHHGQGFDIFDTGNCFVFDKASGKWRRLDHSFALVEKIGIDGIEVPVIDRRTLLRYKRMIDRAVDREDVAAILAVLDNDPNT